ncbi:Gfo/Idh/MocA family protein [Ulvibacterium marinum]|uniref:Gfo/Idh/MocA family oxidoreductase n=1 Tax=Ulvibacterium marinum TaxID=2419782 RepID=A0A3B0C9M1_9FLAO|nr:Gfo/Idh/MocA family oxidoreductase [Ulvibacterium marinum]RKN82492.1 gfo/Idh/MocA family oxidoreductase [Ulvibacterium marinum]
MKKLKGVGIGAGYFSQFHYDAWRRSDTAYITALCDVSSQNAQKTASAHDIEKIYANAQEMLEKERPDFVDIITPPETHLELCSLAASYGIPVICQKPFGGNLTTAKKIVRLFNEKNLRLIVHENFRFQPWFREIKSQIDNGLLGDRLHTLNFRLRTGDGWQDDAYMNRQPYFRTMEKLFVYETGVHYIDTFRYLAGEVKKVYAKLGRLNTNIKGEDLAWVHFEFANGTLGILDANRYNENTAQDPRYTFGEMLVEGNKGSIWLNADGSLIHKPLGRSETIVHYERPKKGFAGDCVYAAQEHYTDCLLNNKTAESEGSLYLRNLEIQEAIYTSNAKGIPVSP